MKMNHDFFWIILPIFILIGIIGSIFGAIAAKKRREAFAVLADQFGLNFSPAKDRNFAGRYNFLNKLQTGENRYAFNILSGKYKDNDILVFDYHYETHSTDSKGHRQTHHHYFSFSILHLTIFLPELSVVREGILSKIGQALGYDDIDFESYEFSKKFCVRSKDKKFAYDFCNAKMMEYLLANNDLSIEVENNALSISFDRCLKPEDIEPNLKRLINIRSLIPDYLFSGR
jgi:hypothetical protein